MWEALLKVGDVGVNSGVGVSILHLYKRGGHIAVRWKRRPGEPEERRSLLNWIRTANTRTVEWSPEKGSL